MKKKNTYIEGHSCEVDRCPFCGGCTYKYCDDGSNICEDCDKEFYVIKKESEVE